MLTEFQAEVPDPLIHDLPELLSTSGVRTPAIGVLLPVFIGQRRFKGPPMQIEVQHILWGKRPLRQHGHKQFIDRPVPLDANWRFGRGGRMGRDNYPNEWSPLRQRKIRAVVQAAGRPAFGMPALRVWLGRQTRLHGVSIQQDARPYSVQSRPCSC